MSHSTVAQIKLKSGGMSYAIRLSDGRFILIDGGTSFEADGAYLYEYLCSRTEGEKVVIAAWLFTHGHLDHVALAARFMTVYRESIRIERILYNIPVGIDFCGYDAKVGNDRDAIFEREWFEAVRLYPEADLHEVRTGEVFRIGDIVIEVLLSAEDRYPDPPTNRNETSAVFKLTFENGVRFMVLGDAMGARLAKLVDPASSLFCHEGRLQCEILQVAHHGLAVASYEYFGAIETLYRRISPRICFWPTYAHRFYNDPWCQDEKYIYNRFLLCSVRERNFHSSQTVEINTEDLTVTLLE
ncbi:MAG: MBL fold metallo-hydrolase [Clostridia bacterium]|nr:MBL fold metallo-hydrolase [Clostridia bacterium]